MRTASKSLQYHTVALDASRKAGAYLMKRFRREDRVIEANHRHDVKLDVDGEAEELIKKIIRREFPEHGFVCEESGSSPMESPFSWVIDPLDGTVNFSMGIPHFCTSIAVKKGGSLPDGKGILLAGVVYDPVRKELFSGYRAERGQPGTSALEGEAFLNGIPIKKSGVASLDEAVVAGGFFKTGYLNEGTRIFRRLAARVLKIRFFGSAALDLCYLACGRVNAYIQHSVNEWDIAAAVLIAELAGKRVEMKTDAEKGTLNVLAADNLIFDELKAIVRM